MYFVIYLSTATKPLSDLELDALLQQSRAWNRSVNVTGMLLYSGDSFMQFLEGEREEVLRLLNKIRVDPRHHGLVVLVQDEHPTREFTDWAMAYKKLDDETRIEVPGYSDYLELPLTREKFLLDPTKTLELLLAFKRSLSPAVPV